MAKVLLPPVLVISRFKKLVYPFLWGSKVETVGRTSLSAPIYKGGLGLIDFVTKGEALKISSVLISLDKPDTKSFFLVKYFIGSQLARLRPEWSHLRDNSVPSALKPTKFYEDSLKVLTSLLNRLNPSTTFKHDSKTCYLELLKETVSAPIFLYRWTTMIGSHLDITCHWSLTRHTLTDNYKNDIAWLITLRGIKVRDSLHTWGYIDTDLCAYCGHKETIDHCFLNCKRAKRVWTAFVPTLSALLNFSFLVNIKTFINGI